MVMNIDCVDADWLAQGRQSLEQGDLDAAAAALRKAFQVPAMQLDAHNLIERHGLKGCFGEWMGLNCEIAPADDIFRFFAGHASCSYPIRDYLADGWRTLSELMLLLERVDRPLAKVGRFLEFASGHGRFTRHLVKAIGAQRVVVSDVVEDAVRFSTERFGVHGVLSAREPAAVRWPGAFDVVFVLSLFSHLPEWTWAAWLRRLYEAVAPGGVLVFTTHGEYAARMQGVALDSRGYFFVPSSESNAIDGADYGTAFTSHAYVMAQIEECIGSGHLQEWAPRYFWAHQDAYVVARAAR
ncbi:class I SAM-dependent methyltransferase [Ramlibacter sp. H39-3-26]|uniref:class I SAM-dependent methyltransferase n=1 Tax=Curvibacter soli TaxID=3031331 RepID=UPI0023D9C03B|nr:class I SAM-dependent methyltransferase [Ramlibacter sp. H39-3-26]MDF1486396.1 class I SAM-dependent methyltransferase [Ramlibacter sp. H39-3-26]